MNKTVFRVSMSEKSVASCKLLINHMQKNNLLPSTIELTNKLIRSVNVVCQQYQLDLEQKKKNAKQLGILSS